MTFQFIGIKFTVSLPFTILLTALFLFDQTGLAVSSVFAVLLHEMGHLLAMSAFQVKPSEIRLIVGAVEIIKPKKILPKGVELFISAAGSLSGFVSGVILYSIYRYNSVLWVANFAAMQISFGIFNLLPATGLDGGEMVSILCSGTKFEKIPMLLSVITILSVGAAGVVLLVQFGGAGLCFSAVYLAVAGILCAKKSNQCSLV